MNEHDDAEIFLLMPDPTSFLLELDIDENLRD